jgi:RimJ/RimL family protein N-acetyltransferase
MWIDDHDREGTILLTIDKFAREFVGLVILFEKPQEEGGGLEVRFGYLLAEEFGGKGFAIELVGRFAGWCRGQSSIARISAGVGPDNPVSTRVSEKSGFHLVFGGDEVVGSEQVFRMNLR